MLRRLKAARASRSTSSAVSWVFDLLGSGRIGCTSSDPQAPSRWSRANHRGALSVGGGAPASGGEEAHWARRVAGTDGTMADHLRGSRRSTSRHSDLGRPQARRLSTLTAVWRDAELSLAVLRWSVADRRPNEVPVHPSRRNPVAGSISARNSRTDRRW